MPDAARPLPEILPDRPRVLFVGINPGLRSGETGHHFAGPGNPFWRLLYAAGLTPVLLAPAEDTRLAEFGLGLTNLCPRVTRTAAELTRAEQAEGRARLLRVIARVRPDVVALVGVGLYPLVCPGGREKGPGGKAERLDGARLFVLPNPSGLNASFPGFEHKLVWFRALGDMLRAPEPP